MGTETQQTSEQRVVELSAEVDALNNEVGRLHHLEQLRNLNFGFTAGQSECHPAKKFKAKQKTCVVSRGISLGIVHKNTKWNETGYLQVNRDSRVLQVECVAKNLGVQQLRPSIWTCVSMGGTARVCWIPVVT